METNRRSRRPPPSPPKKHYSPSEDDVPSSEESAGEDELDQHQSFSNDDDDSDSGDESDQEQPTPDPPHSSAALATIHPPPPVAIHPAPATASIDDDEDDSGEEESESDLMEPNPNTPHTPTASDDDGSDDGDDSEEEDSESEAEPSTPLTTPAATVALTVPVPVPAFASDNVDITGPDSGKDELEIKKLQSGGGETSKKLFERVWTDEDQTTLLKGIIDYKGSQPGKNPMANTEDLWVFLKQKLSFPVTKKQLVKKIEKVKAKYVKNQKRKRPFITTYDAEVFKLSKKLWEENLVGKNGGSKKRKSEELEEAAADDDDEVLDADEKGWEDDTVSLSMNHMSWTEESARAKIKSLDGSVRKLMVQDWKKLKKEQVRCISNRLSLKRESMATIFGRGVF